jgi:RNA polymerase sigma factor (sigma-70 family)
VAYATLLALGVVDAAGYSIIAPVLPELATATSASPLTAATLVAMFPAGMVLGFAAAGAAVKRTTTKPILLGALGLIGIGCLGFVLGGDLTTYLAARFLMGFGSGCLWIGVTFDTLRRWPGEEYVCMSRIFAAYSVGGLIGPALGAIEGVQGPFLAYAAVVLVVAVAAALVRGASAARRFDADSSVLRAPGFWLAGGAILFTVLGLGIVEGVLPLHLASGLEQVEIGLLYACVSLLMAGVAAVAARFAPRAGVLAAAVLVTAGLALAGGVESVGMWLVALIVAGAGIGLGNTGSIGLLLEAVPAERIVTAMVIWSDRHRGIRARPAPGRCCRASLRVLRARARPARRRRGVAPRDAEERRLRRMTDPALPRSPRSATIALPMGTLSANLELDGVRRELHQRVLGYVGRRVNSREDAEDIAQDVMLRIHRHSADLEHVDRMAAWVYRIAANAITDHYRRPARREVPAGHAGDVPEPAPITTSPIGLAPGPEELREALAGCLAPLIERLSPIYREALMLTEFEGISQVDAAARLGITVSGMKARVQRARGQLRALLLDCCHVELDRRRLVTDVRARGGACGTCGAPLA